MSMAKKTDIQLALLPARGPRRRYPWNRWADGSAWALVRGEDYVIPDRGMRTTAHMYAHHHGLIVRTRAYEGGLIIQFFKKQTSAPEKKVKKLRKPSSVQK